MFGQGSDISQVEGCKLCKRLNGKASLLPPDEEGMLKLLNILQDYKQKTNSSTLIWPPLLERELVSVCINLL